jgi:TolB-like protein
LQLLDKSSIAVLPFTNMSGDPEQEYFSDGITEDIITELSRYRELAVTARNSAFTYKGKAVKIQEIGRDLGVTYVVEGSVRKAGNRIRVTAQVIDAVTGNHIWAERYDRELDDVFAVQDEVTRAIVSVLPVRVQQAIVDSAGHKPTKNLTAYDYYLRGRWVFEQSSGEDPTALELFEKALEVDPQCAHAYASIALFYSYSLFSLRSPRAGAERLARGYIEKALAHREGDAVIQAVAAEVYMGCGDHQLASSHAEKAIALNRNDLNAILSYGLVKAYLGDLDESMRWLKEVERLDPLSCGFRLELQAECHYMLRRYQSAIDIYLRWYNPPLHTYTHLAACYAQLGRMVEARDAVALYERSRPANADFARYAAAHCKLCKRDEDARHWMEGYRKAGLID